MLDAYAADPLGDGKPLANDVREKLVEGLRAHPTTAIFLALSDAGQPVGLVTCFRGFSTFAARPLLNIHDVFVVPEMRGKGVSRRLLEAVEIEARATDCCKLTLEVFEQNERAQKIYRSIGFSCPNPDGELGEMYFLSKVLD